MKNIALHKGGPGLTKSIRHNFLQVCINDGARSNFFRVEFL